MRRHRSWQLRGRPVEIVFSGRPPELFRLAGRQVLIDAMAVATPPFFALPDAVCDEVLLRLGPNSFSSVALVCKHLRDAVHRDSLWVQLCERKWGSNTEVYSWRVSAPGSIFSGRARITPTDFRGVHYLLDLGTDLVGLWRADTGNSSKLNQLLAFCWRGDCIKGDWLCFNSMTLPATRNEAYSISSTGSILPEFLSSSNCVLRESFTCSPGQRSRQTSAEAAAAVAIPSMKASAALLGSSPEGSFESEMLKFMQGSVAAKKARKRSSNRSSSPGLPSGGSPNGRATAGRHITRIQRPIPTRQHPLSGLWKGDLGRDGIHIFSISSDFSGPAARISAVQITGALPDQPIWMALAAALPEPWSDEEHGLIAMRDRLVSDELSHIGFGPGVGPLRYHLPEATQVTRCYEGKGLLSRRSATRSRWVDGRLWVYGPDCIGFLWLEEPLPWAAILLDMVRIDGELQ